MENKSWLACWLALILGTFRKNAVTINGVARARTVPA